MGGDPDENKAEVSTENNKKAFNSNLEHFQFLWSRAKCQAAVFGTLGKNNSQDVSDSPTKAGDEKLTRMNLKQ